MCNDCQSDDSPCNPLFFASTICAALADPPWQAVGASELASVLPGGGIPTIPSALGRVQMQQDSISADGRYVVYQTATADANDQRVYLVDRQLGTSLMLYAGKSADPSISAGGAYVTYVRTDPNTNDNIWRYTVGTDPNSGQACVTCNLLLNGEANCNHVYGYSGPAISGDGSDVAFWADFSGTGTAAYGAIYLYDFDANAYELISRMPVPGECDEERLGWGFALFTVDKPTISDSGRFVAFRANYVDYADPLLIIDPNLIDPNHFQYFDPNLCPLAAAEQVFVFDRTTVYTEIATIDRGGCFTSHELLGQGYDVSQTGRYVVFAARDPNLATDPNNAAAASTIAVYVRDRQLGLTQRLSRYSPDSEVNEWPSISSFHDPNINQEGRFIGFTSQVPDCDRSGIFVVDRDPNEQGGNYVLAEQREDLISYTWRGQAASSASRAWISADGHSIAWESSAVDITFDPTLSTVLPRVYARSAPGVLPCADELHTCIGDVNGDGFINQDDLDEVLFRWAASIDDPCGLYDRLVDADCDGSIDQDDIDIVLIDFDTTCP